MHYVGKTQVIVINGNVFVLRMTYTSLFFIFLLLTINEEIQSHTYRINNIQKENMSHLFKKPIYNKYIGGKKPYYFSFNTFNVYGLNACKTFFFWWWLYKVAN